MCMFHHSDSRTFGNERTNERVRINGGGKLMRYCVLKGGFIFLGGVSEKNKQATISIYVTVSYRCRRGG